MAPYRRNVLVGGVVLGALLVLGWMLIQFGGSIVSPFAPETMPVRFVTERADGISVGSAVLYRGVTVGRVERVERASDQLRVYIVAQLDKEPPLPANIKAIIRSTGLVGSGSSIVLELTDTQPSGTLSADQSIPARFVGLDILPTEYAELARELSGAVRELRESKMLENVNQQVERAGQLMQSLQMVIDDPKIREDIRASLANLRSTTEKTDRIADNFERLSGEMRTLSTTTTDAVVSLSKQVHGRLEQVAELLEDFQAIAEKVNKGQGTAGALVNDPRLYQSLVETAVELSATAKDLRRLVEQWEQEGVSLKVK
jgi:phospholipid/cholesterol/gamma-HCH transport system substrate-binding protein